MTQITIDRATLEQLLEDVLQINREIGKGGVACDISNRAYPPIKRSLDALRAAIATAGPAQHVPHVRGEMIWSKPK